MTTGNGHEREKVDEPVQNDEPPPVAQPIQPWNPTGETEIQGDLRRWEPR